MSTSCHLLQRKNPLEVWLDGRNVGRQHGTGVHYYALNHRSSLENIGISTKWLLENTDNTPPKAAICRFFQALCARPPHIGEDSFQSPWGTAHLAHDLYRLAHIHYRYHRKILRLSPKAPPDIMHWTYPLPILIRGCRNIVTVHDLIPLTNPELTTINSHLFRSLMQDLIDHDTYFVTVSETTRQQMLSIFSMPQERITTLYQPIEFSTNTIQKIQTSPQIAPPNSFIFYGRIERRKNIERLITAHKLSKSNTPLVLIGPKVDKYHMLDLQKINNKVIHLPWSNRFSLLRTLSEAKALLFPSLAEGFGLPIIEAMALGVPVLTSRGGATEEIAGKAALLCNPSHTSSLLEKIIQIETMSSQQRQKMIEKGLIISKNFNKLSYQKRYSKLLTKII